jgi:hypothetical protein
MTYNTMGELDEETNKVFRDLVFYIGVEAGVKTTIFATVRSKMAGAGEHGSIPAEQKERLMRSIGEPATMWSTYEAEYRNMFPKNKPGHPAYVGDTNRGERTVVRPEQMIHRANASHIMAASAGTANDVNALIGAAVSIAGSGLRKDTAGATRRRKFNSPESKKFMKAVFIKTTNGRKTKFNGTRATREQEH